MPTSKNFTQKRQHFTQALLVMLVTFSTSGLGGLCQVVEFHQEGSATNGAKTSNLFMKSHNKFQVFHIKYVKHCMQPLCQKWPPQPLILASHDATLASHWSSLGSLLHSYWRMEDKFTGGTRGNH